MKEKWTAGETWLHGGLRMIQVYREVEIRIGLKTKAEALKKKELEKQKKGNQEASV